MSITEWIKNNIPTKSNIDKSVNKDDLAKREKKNEKSSTPKPEDSVVFKKFKENTPKTSRPDKLNVKTSNESIKQTIEEHNLVAIIKSEEAYIEIVESVVGLSGKNLDSLRNDKNELRKSFVPFFRHILWFQLSVLAVLLLCKGFIPWFQINENILNVYMTSVFIETLGAVIIMISFAFNSKEEVQIIKILNAVVHKFRKFGDNVEQGNKKDE